MNNDLITLSRLKITGPVTLSTPLVVLKEIADAHLIRYDENRLSQNKYLIHIINTINSHEVKSVRSPYDMKDYEIIACFVNNKVSWKKGPLLESFHLLLHYSKTENLTQIHVNFKYGRQTPSEPRLLNACVLYGICRANRLETRIDTTIEEMASNIKLLFNLKPAISHSIRTAIIEEITYGNLGNYQLVNILSQIDSEKSQRLDFNTDDETFVVRELNINHVDLANSGTYIRLRGVRTRPRTHIEAVAMAAIHYKLDISEVKNPLAEYQELIRSPYIPLDLNLARRLRLANEHPESLTNPHLDVHFNSNLPKELYSSEDLITMCLDEGYKIENTRTEDPYSILQTASFLATFIHGKQPVPLFNSVTTLADEVADLEYDNVILYGLIDTPLRAYTYGELASTFAFRRKFWRPDGKGELFSEESINKLYLLCQKDRRVNESQECFDERQELEREIDKVRLFLDDNHQHTRDFIERYDHLISEDKKKVERFMTLLMDCGMYMRGWSGQGDYPVSEERTRYPTENEQGFVDIRVSESLRDIDLITEELRGIGILEEIRNLPLMQYRRDEFYHSADPEEGLTIFNRLNIVKGGDDGSIRACIRMSSNRLVASAYFYMSLMKMPLSFDIDDLAHIV